MKLEILIDSNMDIIHVISFCSYAKHSGCYGNKYLKKIDNGGISDNGGAVRGHKLLGNSLVF